MTRTVTRHLLLATLLLATLIITVPAFAGPPLLCHPFDIGSARSLPWLGPGWSATAPNYDTSHLIDDTLALLQPDTPVLVRMETLRRATVYARKDPALAQALFARLQQRALAVPASDAASANKNSAKNNSDPHAAALALFDLGYLIETNRQAFNISQGSKESYWKFQQPDSTADGYSLILRAIDLAKGDPQMEFAAAVIARWPRDKQRTEAAEQQHLQRALAAAPEGSLLARNLAIQFGEKEIQEFRRSAKSGD